MLMFGVFFLGQKLEFPRYCKNKFGIAEDWPFFYKGLHFYTKVSRMVPQEQPKSIII